MDKVISDVSIGLIIWQLFLVFAVVFIGYYLVKTYRMIKHIKKRLDNM